MSPSTIVHSSEIADLISKYPKGIILSELIEIIGKRFGSSSKFQTGSLLGKDIDYLLLFLEARNKVRIVRDVVYPSAAPVYAH